MKTISLVAPAVALLLGCATPLGPKSFKVTGDYSLRILSVIDSAGTHDLVARGAQFNVTLAMNGTTSGHLFLPGQGSDGGDLDADMAGTWTYSNELITFSQDAPAFLPELPFEVGQNRLSGDKSLQRMWVRIVLTKEN